MCRLLEPAFIGNKLLYFLFNCGHLQNYKSKQGRQYMPISGLYYLDVYDPTLIKQLWPQFLTSLEQPILQTVSTLEQMSSERTLDPGRDLLPCSREDINPIWAQCYKTFLSAICGYCNKLECLSLASLSSLV
jgi:hypothetical protein